MNRNRFVQLLLISILTAGGTVAAGDQANLKLWYTTEATNWMCEALPIGNGHMGAMLFGGVERRTDAVQRGEPVGWR